MQSLSQVFDFFFFFCLPFWTHFNIRRSLGDEIFKFLYTSPHNMLCVLFGSTIGVHFKSCILEDYPFVFFLMSRLALM